jgi:hypothetical protein
MRVTRAQLRRIIKEEKMKITKRQLRRIIREETESITNLQFIATYINDNPGARSGEVLTALQEWRGVSGTKGRGWGQEYFAQSRGHRGAKNYAGRYWEEKDPANRYGGWVITPEGSSLVVTQRPLPPHKSMYRPDYEQRRQEADAGRDLRRQASIDSRKAALARWGGNDPPPEE